MRPPLFSITLFCSQRGKRNHGRCQGILDFLQATILLSVFLNHAAGNEVLELFVRPQPEHLLATTGGISRPQVLVQDLEELFELE